MRVQKFKSIVVTLFLSMPLLAGTYDYNYDVKNATAINENKKDFYMYTTFEDIIRFDMLHFDDLDLEDESKDVYKNIVEKIKSYTNNKREIKVTVIGYTKSTTDDMNEITIDSDTYANRIQDLCRYSLDTNESIEMSKDYAFSVNKMLLDDNVSTNIIDVDYRGAKDIAYSDKTSYGRELSNRVMVSIYVLMPVNVDTDGDGVLDINDNCPDTPKGVLVSESGCALDTDQDGIVDYLDSCPQTPLGVQVDSQGCPIDTDGDGVYDYLDNCANTPKGVKVDPRGCPMKQNLGLNFETSSDKILQESNVKVEKFANFLKENPYYNVVITGHTDSNGKAVSNMKLSQRRSASVKAALVALGVEASVITTKGRGELDPIANNRTKEGRKTNRRIEVELSFKE